MGPAVPSCFLLALALVSGAAALRRSPPAAVVGNSPSPGKRFRQQLLNNVDMQYNAEVQVGGQTVRVLPDTGSYEIVLFGKQCQSCGGRGAYDSKTSLSFTAGPREKEQNYGSGRCMTRDAHDSVEIGPLANGSVALWEATKCELPLLKTGGFDAVMGLGPPGHEKHMALNMLDEIHRLERRYRLHRTEMPEKVARAKHIFEDDVFDSFKKPTLLESLGVTIISFCFGRTPGSPGFLVWNDVVPKGSLPLPVFSGIDWSARLRDLAFVSLGQEPVQLGCAPGPCHAVLDTGTSLLGVPGDVYQAVLAELNKDDSLDCSDLRKFPDLVFNLGEHVLRLPPEAYIGVLEGKKSKVVSRFLHSDSVGSSSVAKYSGSEQCQLLMLDNGNNTAEDGTEEFVLGVPFFREYYTTFDLGRPLQGQQRKMFAAPAGDRCQPVELARQGFNYERQRRPVLPRRVDASQVQLPRRWLSRLL